MKKYLSWLIIILVIAGFFYLGFYVGRSWKWAHPDTIPSVAPNEEVNGLPTS